MHSNVWALASSLVMLSAPSALAATIAVPCSGGSSKGLIAAIEKANGTSGANIIDLAPGCVYTLTAVYSGSGQNGLPPITGTITINGFGATIKGSQPAGESGFRILAVTSGGSLTLNTITIKGGRVLINGNANFRCEDTAGGNIDQGFGGGLCIDGGGTATLNHTTVTENTALSGEQLGSFGGGINNNGSITLNHSIISKNTAAAGGGIGSDGSLTLNHSTVTENTALQTNGATGASGGGINANGSVTLNCSRVSKNTAVGDPNNTASSAEGGGIASFGSLTLEHSTVAWNTAILGDREHPASGQGAIGGGILAAGLIMRDSVVANNTAKAVTSFANSAGIVVGVGGVSAGSATIERSVIRNNMAVGIGDSGSSVGVFAGGIELREGTAKLDHTGIFGNTAAADASSGSESFVEARGGGVDIFTANATLTFTVIHCNTVRSLGGTALGGGIHNGGTAALDHSEVLQNTAEGQTIAESLGGGIYNANPTSGSVTLTDSKVQGNHPDQCDPAGSVPACAN